jgi:multiple RNA-binding domain-containing protein 1
MTSRLIVKNLPKHLKEVDLAKHFESNKALDCTVTDAKIMTKNNRSRLFGFVGFKNEEQAEKALKYFNNTFLHTSRISVEAAKAQGDETLARPWSKHSMGSSAF